MSENERHIMFLVDKDTAGAEEWFCPICGRRFVMHWPPDFKRTILEPGDENVIHVGGKGDMSMVLDMGAASVEQDDPPEHFNCRSSLEPKEPEEPLPPEFEEWLKGREK